MTVSACVNNMSRRLAVGAVCTVFGIGALSGTASAQIIDEYFPPIGSPIGNTPSGNPSPGTSTSGASIPTSTTTTPSIVSIGEQVVPRVADQYASPGVRAGSFVIRPNFQEGIGYNSNVEGFSRGPGSSFASSVGSLDVRSDWSRNSVYMQASVDDRRYLDLPNQSFTNWTAGVGGTVDVGRNQIGLSYSHLNLTQTPDSLNAITVLFPVAFRVDAVRLSYTIPTSGRLTFTPEIDVTRYDFDNYVTGGQLVSEAFRNRVVFQGGLTTSYALAPRENLLFVVRGTHISYLDEVPNLPRRDSNGGAALVGVDFPAIGSNFQFRVLAGYQVREYVKTVYGSLNSPIVEASVTWTPTRLTTVTLQGRRDIEDAADDNIAGYTYSALRLGANHELRYNVIVGGHVELQRADYQSTKLNLPSSTTSTALSGLNEAGTSQNIYNAGATVSWLLNRNMKLGVTYDITRRDGGSSYLSNIGLVTLGFRL